MVNINEYCVLNIYIYNMVTQCQLPTGFSNCKLIYKQILYLSFSFSPWPWCQVRTLEEWCNELANIPLQHHPGTELGSPRSAVDHRCFQWTLGSCGMMGCRWLYGYSHDVIGRIIEVGHLGQLWQGEQRSLKWKKRMEKVPKHEAVLIVVSLLFPKPTSINKCTPRCTYLVGAQIDELKSESFLKESSRSCFIMFDMFIRNPAIVSAIQVTTITTTGISCCFSTLDALPLLHRFCPAVQVVTGETLDVVIRNKVTVPLHMAAHSKELQTPRNGCVALLCSVVSLLFLGCFLWRFADLEVIWCQHKSAQIGSVWRALFLGFLMFCMVSPLLAVTPPTRGIGWGWYGLWDPSSQAAGLQTMKKKLDLRDFGQWTKDDQTWGALVMTAWILFEWFFFLRLIKFH